MLMPRPVETGRLSRKLQIEREACSGPDGLACLVEDRAGGLEGARGRFEVGASPPTVRLEMVALRPFVPRVHEEEAFFGLTPLERVRHHRLQPPLVDLRRRLVEDVGPALATGGIVPSR